MKFCFEIKLEAVKRYLSGYTERYRLHGEDGLKRHSYTKRTKEMRLQIVSEHLIESVSETRTTISAIMVSCLQRKDGHWLRHLT